MDNEILKTVFGLLGGLAVFLFGMNMMSEGLQKVAGEKMRYILGLLTKNAVMGYWLGPLPQRCCRAVVPLPLWPSVLSVLGC